MVYVASTAIRGETKDAQGQKRGLGVDMLLAVSFRYADAVQEAAGEGKS